MPNRVNAANRNKSNKDRFHLGLRCVKCVRGKKSETKLDTRISSLEARGTSRLLSLNGGKSLVIVEIKIV